MVPWLCLIWAVTPSLPGTDAQWPVYSFKPLLCLLWTDGTQVLRENNRGSTAVRRCTLIGRSGKFTRIGCSN